MNMCKGVIISPMFVFKHSQLLFGWWRPCTLHLVPLPAERPRPPGLILPCAATHQSSTSTPVHQQRCCPTVPCLQELLASMAPKKANWDLKREIEPRLAKLERRTQRALVEIMLEEEQKRMQIEGGAAD